MSDDPPKWRRFDGYWRLDGHTPVKCSSVEEWAGCFEDRKRIVAQTTVGDFWVSTVFLGIDHRFMGDGPPLLFETMIFDNSKKNSLGRPGNAEDYQERYSTWEEAEAGHARAIEEAQRLARKDPA